MATCTWIGTDTGNEGDWATAANWSGASVPANDDDVYLTNSSQSVTEGFAQSAVTLASLTIDQSFTGAIGDSTSYLAINATLVDIGKNDGFSTPSGSGRIKLNLGTVVSTVTIHNTSSSSTDTDKEPVRILATKDTTVIRVKKGRVGIATDAPGETSSLASVYCDYVSSKTTDSDVRIGSGVTLVSYYQTGGEGVLACAATTVSVSGGTLTTTGTGAITTLNTTGTGIAIGNSTGAITTANTGGTLDMLQSTAARAITTANMQKGGNLKYNPDIVTAAIGNDPLVSLSVKAA